MKIRSICIGVFLVCLTSIPGVMGHSEFPARVMTGQADHTSKGVLWNNGPIVTNPGGGGAGNDLSMVQTSLGMNSVGFSINIGSADHRIADDFTVTTPWNVTQISVYSYQTNSTTTSPITGARIQIWDGPPNDGGTVVWGDLTTNVLTSSSWPAIYRATEPDPSNTSRPVMIVECDVSIQLQPGQYWLDMGIVGDAAYSGPWLPPVTILGETTTGNAILHSSSVWQEVMDTGSNTPQGMPFIIEGSAQQGSVLTFDDITGSVGTQYSGYTFSPGWSVWDSSGYDEYPQYSKPNVCSSHETEPYIEWDEPAFYLSFFINCHEESGYSYTFTVYDDDNNALDTYTTSYELNHLLVFDKHDMRRLEISGTGEWNTHYTIDQMTFIHGMFPECPAGSLFSQPHDVYHPDENSFSSDHDGAYVCYENYSVPAGTMITELTWWGVNEIGDPSGFDVVFYADDGGSPGGLVSSCSVTPDSVDTGLTIFGFPIIMYTADLPEPETQTTGWISIIGAEDGNYFYWANSTFGDGLFYLREGTTLEVINDDLALCLCGAGMPTPTPTPECSSTGCEVVMPSHDFGEGDTCYCDVYVCNMDGSPLTENPLFVILDVYGAYFFAPSFSAFDYYSDPIPAGMSTISVLPSFAWPSGAGTASGLFWYAAMTDPGITTLYGGLGSFEFGWH